MSKQVQRDSIKAKNEKSNIRTPKVLFSYPALPRVEIASYFLIILITISYAYWRLYQASRSYNWDPKKLWWSEYKDYELPFGWGTHRKDVSDFEWHSWSSYPRYASPWFLGHFILLNIFEKFFPAFCSFKSALWSKVLLGYWILAHCFLFGSLFTAIALLQASVMYLMAGKLKSRILLWLMALIFLYPSMQTPILTSSDDSGFWVITLMSYKTLHYLSYTLDMIDEDQEMKSESSLLEMLTFAFYLPYSISLIVLAKDARRQRKERQARSVQWKETLFFGVRILFWYFVAEAACYLLYFQAFMNDPGAMMTFRKDTLVNVGMAVGQFFQLKYVVIFGFPAFFARLDRMQPLPGPICISRITVYSKIWRFFDRGLYAWFKEYIFLPLCRPTFSIWRKLSAIFVTYSFVLLWHGFTHDYIVWVILSVCEIFVEQVGKGIYAMDSVRNWRERRISDTNFRRILAWLQVITFAFGLYSNFYFLGSSEAGYVFVQRIFWEETVPVKWPFILLICLGYCQAHVCMEVDRLQSGQRQESEEGKGKKD